MTAISLPFRIDGYGRVASTDDPRIIWAGRVRSVITTMIGERVMRPTFGCDVMNEVFDAAEETPDLVEQDIRSAFSEWLPELTVEGVGLDLIDESTGELELSVVYTVPGDTSVTDSLVLPFFLE